MTRQTPKLGRIALTFLFWLMTTLALASGALAQTPNMVVYDDQLENGWQNWSWNDTINLSNTSPVTSSSDSIAVSLTAYGALYLHSGNGSLQGSNYTSLDFWINGGAAGGQQLQVQATVDGAGQTTYALPPLEANTWQEVTIPLSSLGVAASTDIDGFWIQDASGNGAATFYVDGITFLSTSAPPPAATVSIDAQSNVHPISPLIYGEAFATTQQLEDLNATLNRSGGNNETRYNWQINAINLDNDWYFESVPGSDGSAPGADQDAFFSGTKTAGATAAMTVPMLGWVANLGANRSKLDSFSVAKYGAQQSSDPYWSDAGNGVYPNGSDVVNDPNDADVPSNVAFQTGWIDHMINTWGTAANGGLKYYLMDNEPSIWYSTHRDVHPNGAPMGEIYSDIAGYGGAVKAADPGALVMGPEEWGWDGYFYSGEDQQYGAENGWSGSMPDMTAHNGIYYVPWLLQQLQSYQNTNGTRLLDVLSLHFYPQGNEYSSADDPTTDLLRNRSTRQLWDPNYVSESWIGTSGLNGGVVELIPLMKSWVNSYYPGTKTAITEYNWGDEDAMNGATTQADILGIFGQQGLDMATRWGVPDPSGPAYQAMKIYRNYDGDDSTFGDTSVSDAVPDPDNLSSFAAVRSSDGALTVMVINKWLSGQSTPVTINLANFLAGPTAQVWQLSSANPTSIVAQPDVAVTNGSIAFSAAPQTVTLFIVPKNTSDLPTTSASITGPSTGPLTVTLTATDPDYQSSQLTTYYTLDGGAQQTYTGPITVSAYGNHSITYYSVNPANNSESPHTQTFVVDYSAPSITSLSPTSATTGSAGFTLTINGRGFLSASTVTFGGNSVAAASVTSTAITTPVTSAQISVARSIPVVVTNPTPGGGTASATFTVKSGSKLSGISLSSSSVVGGTAVTTTITLTANAPAGGAIVQIASGNPSVASVPGSTVTVAAGTRSAKFTVTTYPVASSSAVSISATLGVTSAKTLTVKPPAVKSLALSPTSVVGGAPSTGTVVLTGAAAAATTISVSSSSGSARAAGPVVVPAGHSSTTFTINTTSVSAAAKVTITASGGGVSKSAALTIKTATTKASISRW